MLLSAIATALVADVGLTAVFAFLARSERQHYLRYFAMSWAFVAVRYAVSLVDAGSSLSGAWTRVIIDVSTAGVTWFLLAGVTEFIGRPLHRAWALALVPAIALSAIGEAAHWPFWLARFPTFLLLGVANFGAGVVLFRGAHLPAGSRRLVGATLMLWGLHRVDYPFLREVPWFAPWGFSLSALFELTVAVGMLVLHFELSRRRQAEADARYRSLLEQTTQGIFRSSRDGFVSANPALVKMLGYDSEAELLAVKNPEDVYADPAQRRRLVAQGASVVQGLEIDLKRKDGSIVTVQLHGRAVPGAGGEGAFEGFVTDVTGLKALQARLLQAQKMEALGRVAGGVAHDFNNLLTLITNAGALLRQHVAPGDLEYVDAIDDAAQRAAGLTRQLLAFSRRGPAQSASVDLARSVHEATGLLRRLAGPAHPLEVTVPDEALFVSLGPDDVSQVLLNLVVNARDAMRSGGPITVRLARDAGSAVLEVADAGIGMDDATRQRVFEPFFTTKESGTGLGLATVYGLVTRAGGSIDVASAPGAGTTFTLRFPLRTPEASERAAAATPRRTPRVATLLLVDDDPLVLRATRRVLEGAGHHVEGFTDPKEALAWAVSPHGFDVLVSDVNMPGLDGVELAKRLAPAPAVLISGDLGPAARAALPATAQFVRKPFQPEDLVAAVRGQLERAAAGTPP